MKRGQSGGTADALDTTAVLGAPVVAEDAENLVRTLGSERYRLLPTILREVTTTLASSNKFV